MPAIFQFAGQPKSESAPALNHPRLALVVYTGERALLLKHPITLNARGQPVMGAGCGVGPADRRVLLEALGAQGLTPVLPNTLATSPVATAWWVPAGARAIFFEPKYRETGGVLEFTGVPVPWPPLVFIAVPGRLQVFALSENLRPGMETPLMHAPFWNVFGSGVVCRGTAVYPEAAIPEMQAAWETVFFQSVFTGPSRTDRYINWGRSYGELLGQARAQGVFPRDVLVSAGLTLREALG